MSLLRSLTLTALAAFAVATLALLLTADPAGAQERDLEVSPDPVETGGTVEVTGTCGSDSADATVQILLGGDIEGGVVGETATDGDGRFAGAFELPEGGPIGTGSVFVVCSPGDALEAPLTIVEAQPTEPPTDGTEPDPPEQPSGELLAFWQDRLNDWFALRDEEDRQISVDGIPGPNTEAATRYFEEQVGQTVNGVVEPADRVALRERIEALDLQARTLEPGESGELVSFWQDRLNDWFALRDEEDRLLAVDGILGPNTEAATRYFEEQVGQTVNGVVEPADRVALRDAIEQLDLEARTLEPGESGELVAFWQDELNDWLVEQGRDPIAVDGILGPNTEEATRFFEEQVGQTVNGVVEPADRVALREAKAGEDGDGGGQGDDGEPVEPPIDSTIVNEVSGGGTPFAVSARVVDERICLSLDAAPGEQSLAEECVLPPAVLPIGFMLLASPDGDLVAGVGIADPVVSSIELRGADGSTVTLDPVVTGPGELQAYGGPLPGADPENLDRIVAFDDSGEEIVDLEWTGP